MSLVREKDLYNAYCVLCFYTGQIPLCKSKWMKQSNTPKKQNGTVEDIQNELDTIREYA